MAKDTNAPENLNESAWIEPNATQIAAWKKKHECDNIVCYTAVDPRDKSNKNAYFRQPKFVDLQRAQQSEKAKAGTYNQSIFENCILDSHPDVRSYEPLFLGIIFQLDELNTAAEVRVSKL